MKSVRFSFTLRAVFLLFTAATVAGWWWWPGPGVRFHGGLGNDAGYFPTVERLRTFADYVESEKRTPDFSRAFTGWVPPRPPDYVNFARQDMLIVPHQLGDPVVTPHVRLGGHLVVFCRDQPGRGNEGLLFTVPKQASVQFWSKPFLTAADIVFTLFGVMLLGFSVRTRRA